MYVRIFFSTIAALFLLSHSAHADDTDTALEVFYNTCLLHGPDFDRTTAAAAQFGWNPLPVDAVAALSPMKNVDDFRGWDATESSVSAKTMIGVSKATVNGMAVQTCTVAMFGGDYAAFEERFFSRTDAEKNSDQGDGTQNSKVYILIAGGRQQIVQLTFSAASGPRSAVIASSIAPDQRED
jgi:hypothetical protein